MTQNVRNVEVRRLSLLSIRGTIQSTMMAQVKASALIVVLDLVDGLVKSWDRMNTRNESGTKKSEISF